MKRTIPEINEKIRKGKVVVLTAEEAVELVKEKGVKKAAAEVDVVTTGTFGPMCSSGAFFNVGHAKPKIKLKKAWMNDIEVYCGLAAVDVYLGATELPVNDPENEVYPGKFTYGGGHVIHDLVAGKEVKFRAIAYGTDCYPNKEASTTVALKDLNEAYLFNPPQLLPELQLCGKPLRQDHLHLYGCSQAERVGNANFCSAAQLSPLLKDPLYRTIGIGTRIFLGGGSGIRFLAGNAAQPGGEADRRRALPISPAGDPGRDGRLEADEAGVARGREFHGIRIIPHRRDGHPHTDPRPGGHEARGPLRRGPGDTDRRLLAMTTPSRVARSLGQVTYAELRSGSITVEGKEVPTVFDLQLLQGQEGRGDSQGLDLRRVTSP